MSGFSSSLLVSQMKLLKKIIMNMKVEDTRRYQDLLGDLEIKALKGKVRYEKESFSRFEAVTAYPVDKGSFDRVMLYLHGGSYTSGSLKYAEGFGGAMAEYFGNPVLCAAYRLAPEDPYPAALEDAFDAYVYLHDKYGADKIYLVGESAGGGLMFALLLKLKNEGMDMPAGCVALSPWTDLTFSGESYKTNEKNDPSLFEASLRKNGTLYRGSVPAEDPYISPVFADTKGFPPTAVICGTIEILYDDSVMMAKKLAHDGVDVFFKAYEGMWHVFVLFPIPEAKEALGDIKEFIERCERKRIGEQ